MKKNNYSELDQIRDAYIELCKKAIIGFLIQDSSRFNRKDLGFFNKNLRNIGFDWPVHAHSMIGLQRMNNLEFCIRDVLSNKVEGDLIETGVWRGGATIFMRAILKAFNCTDRKVWVADSFAGLPAADFKNFPKESDVDFDKWNELVIPLEEVKGNFEKYDLLDEQVVFLKGFFKDTMPSIAVEKLAVIRLDGDMYESTIQCLEALYPKLSIGGYTIIDDYGAVPACAQAVHDYREAMNITEEMIKIDWAGVYWKKLQ